MVVNHKSPQADQFTMGDAVGGASNTFLAVCALAIIVTIVCISGFAEKTNARASIQDYLKGPNLFYPSGYDRPGPVNLTIQTIGWNATRTAGNLGIGNGSVRTFDRTSTFDVEYPEQGFMAGDVSTQPWIPGLKTGAPQEEAAAAEAATGSTEGELGAPAENVNAGKTADSRSQFALALRNASLSGENVAYNRTGGGAFNQSGPETSSATNATNLTAPVNHEQATAAFENQTFAAYHPIQYLHPVKDLLYEHPLATSGCAYCQLLGFETPTGDLVNVGMKATGYGY